MKYLVLTCLSVQISILASAQVQIGSATLEPTARFQVDAASGNAKGFLPPRIALTATSSILPFTATPAAGLLVYNTATAGASPSNVTPGLYYYDGAKWQRVINQQPDATVTFNGANPNSGASGFSGTQQSTDFVYVSNTDASQWTWNPSANSGAGAYVTYSPPASTAWYTQNSSTTDAGSNKTSGIYRTGNVGIGDFSATSPATKLELKSGVSNSSGLRLTNLTSASPTSGGATLGVDANGTVVTVNGSSFSPSFSQASPSSTVNVSSNSNALLTSITISSTGTYLINYTMRVQPANALANQYAVGYLALADNNTAISGTEILGAFPGPATAGAPGGNFSGTHVITISSVPTTIYLRGRAFNGDMAFIADGNGYTKISFVKVTP